MEQKYIKDNDGNIVLPITSVTAVRDNKGQTLAAKIEELELKSDGNNNLIKTEESRAKNAESSLHSSVVSTNNALNTERSERTAAEAQLRAELNAKQYEAEAIELDAVPTKDSTKMVNSGAVYTALQDMVYDVSVKHPASGVDSGNTYTLSGALAVIPTADRKAGMSIKFIDSEKNEYVQYRFLGTTTDGFISTVNWSFCGDDVLIENPEWIYILLDTKNRILAGLKSDGSVEWSIGVPTPVKAYINNAIAEIKNGTEGTNLDGLNKIIAFFSDFSTSDTLKSLLDTKVDKEGGKSLIDAEYAERVYYIEGYEFVEVKLDAENKIIWAIKADGDIYFGAGVPSQIVQYVTNKISELGLDDYNNIVNFLGNLVDGDKTLGQLLDEIDNKVADVESHLYLNETLAYRESMAAPKRGYLKADLSFAGRGSWGHGIIVNNNYTSIVAKPSTFDSVEYSSIAFLKTLPVYGEYNGYSNAPIDWSEMEVIGGLITISEQEDENYEIAVPASCNYILINTFVASRWDVLKFNYKGDAVNEVIETYPSNLTIENLKQAANVDGNDFTSSFSFNVKRGYNHTSNAIVSCIAKYTTSDESIVPKIKIQDGFITDGATISYIIGAKDNFVQKEWRFPAALDGSDLQISIIIPSGITLTIQSFGVSLDNAINRNSMKIYNHSGFWGTNFNTVLAFNLAAKCGYYGAIVVPKFTSDNVIVCYHDSSFSDHNNVEMADGSELPATSIEGCTFEQVQGMQYKSTNIVGGHSKIPTFEEYLCICQKTGLHPCLSCHPVPSVEQFQIIRALVEKYNLLDKLTIKFGLSNSSQQNQFNAYSVFGTDIEAYIFNYSSGGGDLLVSYLTGEGSPSWDLSKVVVGVEAVEPTVVTSGVAEAMKAAGFVYSQAYYRPDIETFNAMVELGCYSYTIENHFSNGLNW